MTSQEASPMLGMSEGFRNSWQRKVIEATRGNQTRLGAIVIAALGRLPKHPPRFRGTAIITENGFVLADFQGRDGIWRTKTAICTSQELSDHARKLADFCKLNDEDRIEFFEKLRQWIAVDQRARQTPLLDGRKV